MRKFSRQNDEFWNVCVSGGVCLYDVLFVEVSVGVVGSVGDWRETWCFFPVYCVCVCVCVYVCVCVCMYLLVEISVGIVGGVGDWRETGSFFPVYGVCVCVCMCMCVYVYV